MIVFCRDRLITAKFIEETPLASYMSREFHPDDNRFLLIVAKSKQVSYHAYGDRTFCSSTSRLCNTLPEHIKQSDNVQVFIKSSLKT